MDKLVYLTYPAMLALILVGSKGHFKKGEWNEEFLDYKQMKYFQGFLAVCIMLHHIGQEMCASWQTYKLYPGLEFFVPQGFMYVGVFMFCSGYGLYISFEKKPGYLKQSFFRKRVLPILIGLYVSDWIYLIARILMKEKMTPKKLICYITGVSMPNPNTWYAIVMPLLYLIFWIVFRFCRKGQILIVTVCVFTYTFVGTCIDHNDYLMRGEWWYNCVQLFWIGLLFAKYRERLTAWAKKRWILKLCICIAVFVVSWKLGAWAQMKFSYYGEYMRLPKSTVVLNRWKCLVFDMLMSTFFTFILLLLNLKIRIGNKVLGFMGTITFEFYIIHGLTLELFAYKFCDIVKPIVRITNVALMIVVVAAAGIPMALGLKKICHAFDPKKPESQGKGTPIV